jgi:hypothetical protein
MDDAAMKELDEIERRLADEDIDYLLQNSRHLGNDHQLKSFSDEIEDARDKEASLHHVLDESDKQETLPIIPESQDLEVEGKGSAAKSKKETRTVYDRNSYRTIVKSRIIKALSSHPEMPPPSRKVMLEMLHDGRYLQLIPYFKKEVGLARSDTGVKKNLLKALDPQAYDLFKKRTSENDRMSKRRRRKQHMEQLKST